MGSYGMRVAVLSSYTKPISGVQVSIYKVADLDTENNVSYASQFKGYRGLDLEDHTAVARAAREMYEKISDTAPLATLTTVDGVSAFSELPKGIYLVYSSTTFKYKGESYTLTPTLAALPANEYVTPKIEQVSTPDKGKRPTRPDKKDRKGGEGDGLSQTGDPLVYTVSGLVIVTIAIALIIVALRRARDDQEHD